MNEEPKISKNREKKVGIVSSLSEKYTKAKAVIFTNYQGLTHKQIEGLKKELNLPNVKFGIMEGDFVTGEQILKLSTLPTREVLLSQLVFTLKSPISGLHKALNWNLQKL